MKYQLQLHVYLDGCHCLPPFFFGRNLVAAEPRLVSLLVSASDIATTIQHFEKTKSFVMAESSFSKCFCSDRKSVV